MIINLMQRGNLYFVQRKIKRLWGAQIQYLAMHWLPNIEWRNDLNSAGYTSDLKVAEAAYEMASSADRVVK